MNTGRLVPRDWYPVRTHSHLKAHPSKKKKKRYSGSKRKRRTTCKKDGGVPNPKPLRPLWRHGCRGVRPIAAVLALRPRLRRRCPEIETFKKTHTCAETSGICEDEGGAERRTCVRNGCHGVTLFAVNHKLSFLGSSVAIPKVKPLG